jgi:ATP-dependent Clp protease adaptor protein ClpS
MEEVAAAHFPTTTVVKYNGTFVWRLAPKENRNFPVSDQKSDSAVVEPTQQRATSRRTKKAKDRKRQPRYHVILWDDNDHTYDYVVGMMRALFGHDEQQGFKIASEVDHNGRAVCLTTTREHAELKRDQIHAFGKDKAIARCKGSMSATIEPES